jgi:hypothetical protein
MYEASDHINLKFNNMSTAVVFLVVGKTFNTIWNCGILYKLPKLEFGISIIGFINSQVMLRKLKVSVGSEKSTSKEIQAGVPQGSALSPTYLLKSILNNVPQTLIVCVAPLRQITKKAVLSESCGAASFNGDVM